MLGMALVLFIMQFDLATNGSKGSVTGVDDEVEVTGQQVVEVGVGDRHGALALRAE